jgi:hypothetical protein
VYVLHKKLFRLANARHTEEGTAENGKGWVGGEGEGKESKGERRVREGNCTPRQNPGYASETTRLVTVILDCEICQ